MGVRKAFIDWKRLQASDSLEDGKEYLAFDYDQKYMSGRIVTGTYYKKGTVVDIPLREDYRPDRSAMTSEERLLVAIFGANKKYVVPEDGLYELTADYGVDDKTQNGAFEGCEKELLLLGNALPEGDPGAMPVFWAHMPILPDGCCLHADRLLEDPSAEAMTRENQEVRERLEADPLALNAYKGFCRHHDGSAPAMPGDPDDVHIAVFGTDIALSAAGAANIVLNALEAARNIAKVPREEMLAFAEKFRKIADSAEAQKAWNDFRTEHGIPLKHGTMALQYLQYLSGSEPNFYHTRDRILAHKGVTAIDNAAVLVEAAAAVNLPAAEARLIRLLELGSPEVILANELRIVCMLKAAWRHSGSIAGVYDKFAYEFGINPDGTRAEYCSECGDAELMEKTKLKEEAEERAKMEEHCAKGCENCDAAYCDERDGVPKPEPEDEPDEDPADGDGENVCPCPAQDYIPAYLPNFAMRRQGTCIFNCREFTYVYGEGGALEVYTDREELDKRLKELNGD